MVISKIEDPKKVQEYYYLYRKTNNTGYLDRIMEYISDAKVSEIKFRFIKAEDLLYTNSKGETLLDVLLKNNAKLDDRSIDRILRNPVLLKYIIGCEDYDISKYIMNNNLFMIKIDGNKTVFDLMLEKDKLPPVCCHFCSKISKLVKKMIEKNPKTLQYFDENTIMHETINGEKMIDYIFKNDLVSPFMIAKVSKYYDIFIDYCFKYHKEQLLQYLPDQSLIKYRNGKLIIEYLIDRGVVFNNSAHQDAKILNVLLKKGQYDGFRFVQEQELLQKAYNGKTFLENLLETGYKFENIGFRTREAIELLIKYERYDNVVKYCISALVSPMENSDRTYLDLLIQKYKEGAPVPLSKINIYSALNPEDLAKFYLTIARNGLIEHVSRINRFLLLGKKDGERTIDILLREDQGLTLNTIVPRSVKNNFYVATYLRSKGIDQRAIDIDLYSMDIVDEYYDSQVREYQKESVTKEEQELLDKLQELLLNDNKSHYKYVEALIASYRHLMHMGNSYGEIEVRKLIELKESDSSFSIIVIPDKDGTPCYDHSSRSIQLLNSCITTINHELGHLLHHNFCDSYEAPPEYDEMVKSFRTDKEVIKKVDEFSQYMETIREKTRKIVDEEYMPLYEASMTEEKKNKIKEFLNKSNEEKLKELKEQGYSDNIAVILAKTYSLEEYLEQDKRIKREELISAVLDKNYGTLTAISDILDGIFEGKLYSGELKNNEGKKILPSSGHGIAYYKRYEENDFAEAIANFSLIVKSDDGDKALRHLTEILGNEFVLLLTNFYNKEIIYGSLPAKDRKKGK